jgi:hypothetical protein
VRLCHELRASLPSRHRHLRRGAELQNRSPYRRSPPPQEHVSPSATYSHGAVVELFRPEARVCMGHQLATACGAGLKAVPLPFPSPGPSRSDTDKLRSRRSCVHLSRVPISRNPAAVSGLLLLGDLFHLSQCLQLRSLLAATPLLHLTFTTPLASDPFGISRRQTVASPRTRFSFFDNSRTTDRPGQALSVPSQGLAALLAHAAQPPRSTSVTAAAASVRIAASLPGHQHCTGHSNAFLSMF